jgi:hypothetical protein
VNGSPTRQLGDDDSACLTLKTFITLEHAKEETRAIVVYGARFDRMDAGAEPTGAVLRHPCLHGINTSVYVTYSRRLA